MNTFATHDSSHVNVEIRVDGITSKNDWEVAEIKFHLATVATASNTFTVRQRSKRGSQYDTVILAAPMNGISDLLWQPDYAVKLNGKDRLTVSWTNDAASFKTWGLQVHYRS